MKARCRAAILASLCLVGFLVGLPSSLHGGASAGVGDGPRAWRLSYRIPGGWIADREAASRMQLAALLVPEGQPSGSADATITVAFESRSPFVSTLERFFKNQMAALLRLFPDLESKRWRPPNLEATSFDFASIEITGVLPGPTRVVMIDAGDGFYAINVTVRDRDDLERPDVRAFFDSLLLLPVR